MDVSDNQDWVTYFSQQGVMITGVEEYTRLWGKDEWIDPKPSRIANQTLNNWITAIYQRSDVKKQKNSDVPAEEYKPVEVGDYLEKSQERGALSDAFYAELKVR